MFAKLCQYGHYLLPDRLHYSKETPVPIVALPGPPLLQALAITNVYFLFLDFHILDLSINESCDLWSFVTRLFHLAPPQLHTCI